MKPRALHLSDGAYATMYYTEGGKLVELLITANHHDPQQASDAVFIDQAGIEMLRQFLTRPELGSEIAE